METQNIFLASNLAFLRKRMKISQEDFSTLLGMGRKKYAALESGQTRNPTIEDLIAFSRHFKIAMDTLVTVDLSKLSELQIRELQAGNDVYLKGRNVRVLAKAISADNEEQVEMVTVKAKAGYTAGYGDPDYIAQLPVFHMPQLPKDKKFRMFPISGDSMPPVKDGSFVIVEWLQDITSVKDGTPCVVITKEDGIVFKIVENRIAEDSALRLISLNPSYKTYEIPASEVLELWKYHSYWTDGKLEPLATDEQLLQKLEEVRQEVTAIALKL